MPLWADWPGCFCREGGLQGAKVDTGRHVRMLSCGPDVRDGVLDSWKKLEIELPYDPAIPLLGIHNEETRIERDTCTPMFIAALFIIARTWKQPDVHQQMNG